MSVSPREVMYVLDLRTYTIGQRHSFHYNLLLRFSIPQSLPFHRYPGHRGTLLGY
jgi:hypothetical protein